MAYPAIKIPPVLLEKMLSAYHNWAIATQEISKTSKLPFRSRTGKQLSSR